MSNSISPRDDPSAYLHGVAAVDFALSRDLRFGLHDYGAERKEVRFELPVDTRQSAARHIWRRPAWRRHNLHDSCTGFGDAQRTWTDETDPTGDDDGALTKR